MSTIPVAEVVRLTPGVLPAGGSLVALNTLILTTSTRIPIGTVVRFASQAAIDDYFGPGTLESNNGQHYFPGFLNSNKKPRTLQFTQYPLNSVAAYLRGGDVSSLTLAQLQAFNATLSVTINGVLKTGTVNLAGVASFTQAGMKISDALDIEGIQAASFTGAIATTVLTASAVTGQPLAVGQFVHGASVAADTYITSLGTGTGGAGTYNINNSQTIASEAMTSNFPGITYDSVSGAFVVASATAGAASTITFGSGALATDLRLTSVLGAVLSQGADAATPSGFMNNLVQSQRDFSLFMLNFNPDVTGSDIRFAFAQWSGSQSSRFAYVSIDDDEGPTASNADASCFAARVIGASIEGVSLNWQTPDDDLVNPTDPLDYGNLASFVCGTAGSIDFDQTNGRVVFKFRQQSGLVPNVTDQTVFDNLKANGYNSYGAYADGDDAFTWYADGTVSGPFLWMDTYCNQIALNSSFRSALVDLLQSAYSIPYNAVGRALIEASLADTINKFLNFGAYRAGVVLSASQIASVNASAGKNIADTLTNQGWYLDVGVATPDVRQARGSPPMTFYYVDGESVQEFDMASIALQ